MDIVCKMDFDEKLIEEVKSYNFLYNLKSSDYKNIIKKEEAWNVIGKKLHTSGDICKKRWKNLRDTYKKAKQREEVRSGSAATENKRPWKYYEMLSFLDGVQSSRKTVGNIPEEDIVVVEDSNPGYFEEDNELPSCSINCAQHPAELDDSMCSTSAENPRKRKHDSIQEKFSNFFDAASASINKICTTFEEKQKAEKNSTKLLFAALENRIENANLSPQQLLDLEINIASCVYQKISEMQKK